MFEDGLVLNEQLRGKRPAPHLLMDQSAYTLGVALEGFYNDRHFCFTFPVASLGVPDTGYITKFAQFVFLNLNYLEVPHPTQSYSN